MSGKSVRVWMTRRLAARVTRAAETVSKSHSRFLKDAVIEAVVQVEAEHSLPADIDTEKGVND